jgi:hypothetical protein
MSQSKSQGNLVVVLDSLVKFLGQTAGKDKIAKLLQYGGKLVTALAAAQHAELAGKAKKIESAASAARKVFRLGNELAELQKIRTLLKSSGANLLANPLALLSLARGVGMYFYWTFDHLVWAANTGLSKLDGPKYAYYGAVAWCVGLISTLLIDLHALNRNINQQRSLQLDQWSSSAGGPTTKEGKSVMTQQMRDVVAKKNEILLNCVKNVADLGVAMYLTKVVDLSQGKVGFLGVVSALIGAYQLYPPL